MGWVVSGPWHSTCRLKLRNLSLWITIKEEKHYKGNNLKVTLCRVDNYRFEGSAHMSLLPLWHAPWIQNVNTVGSAHTSLLISANLQSINLDRSLQIAALMCTPPLWCRPPLAALGDATELDADPICYISSSFSLLPWPKTPFVQVYSWWQLYIYINAAAAPLWSLL